MGRVLDELSIQALKVLNRGFLDTSDLFDFLASGAAFNYRYRLGKEEYKAFKKRSWQRRVALNAEIQATADKKRFTNLIYRLQSQGLISKSQKGKRATLSITQKGIEKFNGLKKYLQKDAKLRPPIGTPTHYEKIKSPSSIIISFDIPEKERSKRDWLRSALHNLDYKILHHSVWIGGNIIPKDLLDECKNMGITRYVHIFSVTKKGTIGG